MAIATDRVGDALVALAVTTAVVTVETPRSIVRSKRRGRSSGNAAGHCPGRRGRSDAAVTAAVVTVAGALVAAANCVRTARPKPTRPIVTVEGKRSSRWKRGSLPGRPASKRRGRSSRPETRRRSSRSSRRGRPSRLKRDCGRSSRWNRVGRSSRWNRGRSSLRSPCSNRRGRHRGRRGADGRPARHAPDGRPARIDGDDPRTDRRAPGGNVAGSWASQRRTLVVGTLLLARCSTPRRPWRRGHRAGRGGGPLSGPCHLCGSSALAADQRALGAPELLDFGDTRIDFSRWCLSGQDAS